MPIDTSTLTPQQQITAIYVAYYDRAPDPAGLQFWVDQLNGGRSLEQIATDFSGAAETIDQYPFFDAPDVASGDTFITQVYLNLFGRVPDAAGSEFWSNQLESDSTPVGEIILAIIEGAQDTAEGDDLSTIQNKIDAGLDWATDAAEAGVGTSTNLIAEEIDGQLVVNDQAAFDSATSILDGVTGDPATVADAATTTDAFFGGNAGQTFTLTEGSDQIPGLEGSEGNADNSADDLIIGGSSNVGGVANTLGTGDDLDGGTGFDTLRVLDNAGETFTPMLNNIESVEVQATGGTTNVNMINAAGVEQAWNYRSTSNVNYTNLQNAVVAGVMDSNTRLDLTYENGVDLGGEVSLVVDGAGVVGDAADIYINSDDAANLTDLNVTVGATDSYVNVDIDAAATPGATPAAFENLTIAGAGGLLLREANGEGETDFVTMVDATGLAGWLDLDLSANDQDIDFDGGNGDTMLITGNGDSDILTGEGDDSIMVGSGDNTINTGAGVDSVVVGNGNNVVNTGADNDVVDITAGGDQDVMLGDGDDVLLAGSMLSDDDAIEAGDGIDTLVVDVDHADAFTANGDVDAVVNGFEQIELTGTVDEDESLTVDLDNIDDIADVTISADVVTGTAVAESQYMDFQSNFSAFPATITIEGVEIEIAPGLDSYQVADFIATNFGDQIVAAYNANHPGEVMTSLTSLVPGDDQIQFDFDRASGDVPTVAYTVNTGPLSAGAGFNGAATTVGGTSAVNEVQTLTVDTSTFNVVNGTFNITLDTDVYAPGTLVIPEIPNETTVEVATRIVTEINNNATNVTASLTGTSTVTLTYNALALGANANVNQVGIGSYGGFTTIATSTPGIAAAAETQTVEITAGTDVDGGYVRLALGGNQIDIEVPAGLSGDQLGAFIVSQLSDITAAIPEVASVDYDSATNNLTFNFTVAAGNVGNIVVSNTPGNFANVFDFQGDIQGGTDGSLGGVLTIDNMASGGTVTLNAGTGSSVTGGETIVNLTTDTASDMLNVEIDAGFGGTGQVTFAGVETLMFNNMTSSQQTLNLEGSDAESVTVSGTGGVEFVQDFLNLTSLDASALDIEVGDAGVSLRSIATEDATLTGSAGVDVFFSGAGDDVIMGGTGNDEIHGREGDDTIMGGEGDDDLWGNAGTDVLSGDAGDDTFHYTAVSDSQGTTVDTITDFMSGEDTIDLSAITGGTGSYTGEANAYGAVLTSLQSTGDAQAVLDTSTSTLYVDVNGDGNLDNQDMAIDLTGVTALDNNTDFTF